MTQPQGPTYPGTHLIHPQSCTRLLHAGVRRPNCLDAPLAGEVERFTALLSPSVPLTYCLDAPRSALRPLQVKHSFLVQFLQDEEAEASHAAPAAVGAVGPWGRALDAVFGIAAADPKLGKEGSRVVHPQSPFATGLRPAPTPHTLPPSADDCR